MGTSVVLNLDLWWVDGELRFWDPIDERWLLSHEEEHARAEGEAARAAHAENERDRQVAARQKAEIEILRLRQRLAELGEAE